jgi:hypothetical protein
MYVRYEFMHDVYVYVSMICICDVYEVDVAVGPILPESSVLGVVVVCVYMCVMD